MDNASSGPGVGDAGEEIINSPFGLVTSAADPRIGRLAMKFLF